jgi:hypothetical protein
MYRAAARHVWTHARDAARALALLRTGLGREPESPELLLLAEEIAGEARAVEPMLVLYADLDAVVAGEHGRRALLYRRAAFLETAGEHERALESFLAAYEKNPVHGAVFTAIERLAAVLARPAVLVDVHRRLADHASTPDAKVRHYLLAASVAREQVHDRRAALELGLLAHDVRRDDETAVKVLEIARSLKSLDPQGFRGAVETLVDRAIEIASEVWDDVRKRGTALAAAEMCAVEIGDAARFAAAVEVYFKGVEDRAVGRREVAALLDRTNAPPALREAVQRVGAMTSDGAGAPSLGDPTPAPPRGGLFIK